MNLSISTTKIDGFLFIPANDVMILLISIKTGMLKMEDAMAILEKEIESEKKSSE